MGTDTFEQPAGADRLLAGVRRLTLLADGAGDCQGIYWGLARELLAAPGAEEVHVHRLAKLARSGRVASRCTWPKATGASAT